MLDQGKVFRVEGKRAWIEFAIAGACSQCGACARDAAGKMVNEADNRIGARPGDTVEVEISPAALTLFPLLVFGLPIVLFFIGLSAGSLISETAAIAAGLLFLAGGIAIARLADSYVAGGKGFRSVIVRIIKGEGK